MLWRLKILAKIILTRLPLGYRIWRAVGIFQHGKMHDPSYSIRTVFLHLDQFDRLSTSTNSVMMELGPGDSLASSLIMKARGCAKSYLVDVGDFATKDMGVYRAQADTLGELGYAPPDLSSVNDTYTMLKQIDAVYLTKGLVSLREIPDASVDLIWSHAVLEHVRFHEIDDFFAEFRRVIKPAGVMSHRIDYKDHLAASINNLRFSHRVWESDFMARSGFYTNRLRHSQMLAALCRAGFDVEVTDVTRWEQLPIAHTHLDPSFQSLPLEDLLISGCDLVARPL